MNGYYIKNTHFDGTPKWFIEKPYRHNVVYKLSVGKAVYIGSSTDLQKRIDQHSKSLRENKHSSKLLQREFNLYHFYDLEILEVLGKDADYKSLWEMEQFYMDKIHPNANTNYAVEPKYKTINIILDNDLIEFITTHKNKNRFINDCIRKHYNLDNKIE